MEEKTTQELIHKGFEDMRRWIDEAKTYGQLGYRLGLISEAISGRRMQSRWQSIEQSPQVEMPPDLQLPDWARRLEK